MSTNKFTIIYNASSEFPEKYELRELTYDNWYGRYKSKAEAQAEIDRLNSVTETDLIVAQKAILQYAKHKIVTESRPRFGKKDFNTVMWFSTASAIALATYPWGLAAFPILGIISEHYEQKKDKK
jgi:hypothetical protein